MTLPPSPDPSPSGKPVVPQPGAPGSIPPAPVPPAPGPYGTPPPGYGYSAPYQTGYPAPQGWQQGNSPVGSATGLVLGVVGLVMAFLFWPLGLGLSIAGLVSGRRARRGVGVSIAGLVASSVMAVVTVGLVVWIGVLSSTGSGSAGATTVDSVPSVSSASGGIRVGPAKAQSGAPVVDLYVDYTCPVCGQFEKINGQTLHDHVEDGSVVLMIHPVDILDGQSQGTHYSSRAANAFATVAQDAPTKALAFHEALFANQPAESSRGLTDEQLRALAVGVGVPRSVADSFASGEYTGWVDEQTDTATHAKRLAGPQGFGTPTIVIDGSRWGGNWAAPGALAKELGVSDDGSGGTV